MDFKVVIPARFASSRLPGKPLADIAGKPMVVRVADQAAASGAKEIWVATDHEGVAEAVRQHHYNVVMTRTDHASGTDRIAEVAAKLRWEDTDIVVNVQGDEPRIASTLIRQVAQELDNHELAAIATACHPIEDDHAFFDPNVVKVICDHAGYALYFSRAPVPYARDAFRQSSELPPGFPALRHIGIYAYRVAFLRKYSSLKPSAIETFEALEQLRAMWHGYRIAVALTRTAPEAGVDTLADLERVRMLFGASNSQ